MDTSERVQWTLWERFATGTHAPMHMWQLFGLLVVERVSTETNGRPCLETWNTRELAARLTSEALARPVDARQVRDLVAQTYRGDARDVGSAPRSSRRNSSDTRFLSPERSWTTSSARGRAPSTT